MKPSLKAPEADGGMNIKKTSTNVLYAKQLKSLVEFQAL